MTSRRLTFLLARTAVFLLIGLIVFTVIGWSMFAVIAVSLLAGAVAVQAGGIWWLRRSERADTE